MSQPVHDPNAEAAVLAAAMLSREALVEVRAVLPGAEAFFDDAHRRVWEACCAIDDEGGTADVVTVAGELRRTDRLAQVGGIEKLGDLCDATPAVINVEAHARIVLELWRQLWRVAVLQGVA